MNAEQTVKAVAKVVGHFRDGFHYSDILAAVKTGCEIAEQFTGASGMDKKAFVLEVIEKAYKEVDPNIPWIPEPVETWVENYVFKNLVPAAIDMIVDATKGKVKVNQ